MRKILVVDDERDVCDFVRHFFEERGFQVFTACKGEDAIAIARTERPEMALLDIKMAGMDGIAILKYLKEIDKNVKVIMVTALDDQDKINEACKLGACEYITKPLVLEHLERVVEKKLGIGGDEHT